MGAVIQHTYYITERIQKVKDLLLEVNLKIKWVVEDGWFKKM